MRFFSKIVFICNCCFIVAVILRYVEELKRNKGNYDGAIPFQPLESTVVILGYGAILINLIFNIIVLLYLLKRSAPAPKWIIWFNFLLLLLQFYYFELYKW